MENLKIRQLKSRLKDQWDFFDDEKKKDGYSEAEILNWLASSVVLLEEIGVSEVIIKSFMETFEMERIGEDEIKKSSGFTAQYLYTSSVIAISKLGPFISEYQYGVWGSYKLTNFGKLSYIKIAFRSANAILDRGIEEKRIVPRYLLDALEENGNYNNLISSLELIEDNYEKKDSDGLAKNSLTLLDSILDLDNILKTKKDISKKLRLLMSNLQIREKFGVENQFIFALDNSRIMRNLKSVHKNRAEECNIRFYDIPFLVATTFAYLVITFLEITISTGELIKNSIIRASLSPSVSRKTKVKGIKIEN